jgi:hypothetical protein
MPICKIVKDNENRGVENYDFNFFFILRSFLLGFTTSLQLHNHNKLTKKYFYRRGQRKKRIVYVIKMAIK